MANGERAVAAAVAVVMAVVVAVMVAVLVAVVWLWLLGAACSGCEGGGVLVVVCVVEGIPLL